MAVAEVAKFHSDGKSVRVLLTSTVEALDVVYADGWLGLAASGGDSGDSVELYIDEREYIFDVGADLSVNKGDIVYIDTTALTGCQPTLSGWSTSSGSNLIPLFKATQAKASDNTVHGILIVGEA